MIQNLWDTEKEVLRLKFITIQAYIRKQEKVQINSLNLYLKQLEKEEWSPKLVGGKIIKNREEINEIEKYKTKQKRDQ